MSRWNIVGRWGLTLSLGFLLSCSGSVGGGGGGEDSGPGHDAPAADGFVFGDGVGPKMDHRGPCPGTPCPAGFVCHQGSCLLDGGACITDEDCLGDTYCDTGRCLPYGDKTKTFDPGCKGGGFTAEKFEAPVMKCTWEKAPVISAPVVIDLDGDKSPEIIFVRFDTGGLVAIRGDTCKEVFSIAGAKLGTRSQLAVADLDGDKSPEIVGINGTNHIVIFDHAGAKLATSPAAAQTGPSQFKDGGVAIANLDGQGAAELVYGGMAVRVNPTTKQMTTLFNHPVTGGHWGILTAIADVDLDGTPDIVVGNRIFDGVTGADKTPANVKGFAGGYVAIADFDKTTPEPEIVLISSQTGSAGQIRIYHPKTGKVIFGPYTFGQRWGGPPTVADFDGDGEPEVAAAGYVGYAVFDRECAKTPLPAQCKGPGLRWLKTTRDNSSGSTGSSVFDFNGDGAAEVVYRDECWLRVYDGKTGQVRFAQNITSGTILELPVIADVDNDGHADIVVPAHQGMSCGPEADLKLPAGAKTNGIFVLQDPKNRWMPSRPIWNQHTYHISNINDDGTVPVKEKPSWQGWNNYRQNVQGMIQSEVPATDLTGGVKTGIEAGSDCTTTWVLAAKLCNRGAAKAGAGVSGAFYQGDPKGGGTLICSAKTAKALDPGQCEVVSCAFKNPPKGKIDLWFVADDDGSGGGREGECKEKNNALHLPGATCNKID
ncbi:MAG: VCBS repeat-containing protein [Deltaproteobacteria bacterium]|nr:VCBS repeat-containing protein [Deltaproteobacteria bacterium]